MSILLTGFEPFDGAAINPSWEAVQRVPDTVCGRSVHRLRLPVEYGRAAALLLEEVRRLRPELVLMCGVASGRTGVTPELVALNYRMARIPDNAGQQYSGDPIRPGGETAIMTRLPVHGMVEAIRAEDIPAWVSLSAGAYVCNDLYYHLLEAEENLGCRSIFVHVPDEKDVNAPRAARALTACLCASLKTE
ncbi:MAG: pyroglutamyl-peptidase I [Clostridia bacterium]|nr:pyroglutamyl-peptidase I [Clostridia bacterium]